MLNENVKYKTITHLAPHPARAFQKIYSKPKNILSTLKPQQTYQRTTPQKSVLKTKEQPKLTNISTKNILFSRNRNNFFERSFAETSSSQSKDTFREKKSTLNRSPLYFQEFESGWKKVEKENVFFQCSAEDFRSPVHQRNKSCVHEAKESSATFTVSRQRKQSSGARSKSKEAIRDIERNGIIIKFNPKKKEIPMDLLSKETLLEYKKNSSENLMTVCQNKKTPVKEERVPNEKGDIELINQTIDIKVGEENCFTFRGGIVDLNVTQQEKEGKKDSLQDVNSWWKDLLDIEDINAKTLKIQKVFRGFLQRKALRKTLQIEMVKSVCTTFALILNNRLKKNALNCLGEFCRKVYKIPRRDCADFFFTKKIRRDREDQSKIQKISDLQKFLKVFLKKRKMSLQQTSLSREKLRKKCVPAQGNYVSKVRRVSNCIKMKKRLIIIKPKSLVKKIVLIQRTFRRFVVHQRQKSEKSLINKSSILCKHKMMLVKTTVRGKKEAVMKVCFIQKFYRGLLKKRKEINRIKFNTEKPFMKISNKENKFGVYISKAYKRVPGAIQKPKSEICCFRKQSKSKGDLTLFVVKIQRGFRNHLTAAKPQVVLTKNLGKVCFFKKTEIFIKKSQMLLIILLQKYIKNYIEKKRQTKLIKKKPCLSSTAKMKKKNFSRPNSQVKRGFQNFKPIRKTAVQLAFKGRKLMEKECARQKIKSKAPFFTKKIYKAPPNDYLKKISFIQKFFLSKLSLRMKVVIIKKKVPCPFLKNLFTKATINRLSINFIEIYNKIKEFTFLRVLLQIATKKVQEFGYETLLKKLEKKEKMSECSENKKSFYFSALHMHLLVTSQYKVSEEKGQVGSDSVLRVKKFLLCLIPLYYSKYHSRKVVPFVRETEGLLLSSVSIFKPKTEKKELLEYITYVMKVMYSMIIPPDCLDEVPINEKNDVTLFWMSRLIYALKEKYSYLSNQTEPEFEVEDQVIRINTYESKELENIFYPYDTTKKPIKSNSVFPEANEFENTKSFSFKRDVY